MDPNANLQEQLRLARLIISLDSHNDLAKICEAADRLAKLVEALDGWIRAGGFFPTPWLVLVPGFDATRFRGGQP